MPTPVEIILVPTLMIVLGYVLKRQNILKSRDSNVLSRIVLTVSLPSLVFVNLSTANISTDMLLLPFAAFSLSAICMVISFLFCKSRGYSKVKTWTIMIACAMMNTGFLGFPISLGVFGNEGFLNAIFFDLETTLIFVIFGMVLVSIFGGNRKEVLKQAVGFVPLWAVIIALLFNIFHLQYGYVIETTLNYLGQSTIPLIMISLGLTLDFKEIKHSFTDSLFVAFVKLILAPIIIFLILNAINFGGLSFKVAILEAGMATAMNALVLAITYDLDTKLMSSIIFTNTVLSLITLTGIITLLV
ncbi:MAG: AEC family transporter [Methanosphaera sp.]|uniref:AEC family transporter n=2 Tax=Methanosphaera sp. TaxID=2666342 RepID=UPI002E786C68|nr:AEC family transporter [Methanosphaera sp.]MEE3324139.1 AEC family transporter [Methanosphaera sp.]MEE3417834.1 AEC family transporter [Methanosphaera sp.]